MRDWTKGVSDGKLHYFVILESTIEEVRNSGSDEVFKTTVEECIGEVLKTGRYADLIIRIQPKDEE